MTTLRSSDARRIADVLSDLLPWGDNPTVSRRPSELDPAFDPVAERLVDVGRQLREARQQRGEDLYDVADYLRIKPSYLFALEEGDLSAMPGRTYAMGFLRTYADHLGYDGAEVVRGLNATARAGQDAKLKVHQPVGENRLPSLAMVGAALLLGGVAYGGWFAAQSGDLLVARVKALPGDIGHYAATLFEEDAAAQDDVTAATEPLEMLAANAERPAPGRTAPPSTATASATTAAPAASRTTTVDRPGGSAAAGPAATGTAAVIDLSGVVSATASTGRPASSDAGADTLASLVLDAEAERRAALSRLDQERPDGGTAGDLLAGLQPDAATASEADPSTASPPVAAATNAVVSPTGRVVLLAREASWVQVQSPSRDYITSRTLEPGDQFVIPDRDDLALWTGNAGGLEIWIDGRNIGVLGRSGAVLRDVTLTPESLNARF
jgi:cytoskeleton protein RodZ